ncbi:MAG: hypothetical protein AAFQ45_04810 [Pseudomonadota bacterium]
MQDAPQKTDCAVADFVGGPPDSASAAVAMAVREIGVGTSAIAGFKSKPDVVANLGRHAPLS